MKELKFKNITKKTWVYEDLAFIIPLELIRKTPNVEFYHIPKVIENLNAVDKVIHKKGAKSPQIKNDTNHYWYMHTDQEDKLVVHGGKRIVELYSVKHGKLEKFEVTSKNIKLNGKVIFTGAAILGWPRLVFHRIKSPQGSVSTNYAKHYSKFNINTNFNIFNLDIKLGKFWIVREGHKDQPKIKK
jgi:hypothetical protein